MSLSLNPELVGVLACPETHEPVTLASEAQLQQLREAIAAGTARRRDGSEIEPDFEGALLSHGGKVAYLVRDGIPNLLIDERLELDRAQES